MKIIMDLTVVPPVLLVVLHPGVGSWMVDVMNVSRDITVISVTRSVDQGVLLQNVIKLMETVNVKMDTTVISVITNAVLAVNLHVIRLMDGVNAKMDSMVINVIKTAVLGAQIQHAIKLMVIVLNAMTDIVETGVL